MIVYTKDKLEAYELYEKVPSFIKCENIISNQAFYSLALFRLEKDIQPDIINALKLKARLTGTINEVNDLDDLFMAVDMNEVLSYLVGKAVTEKSVNELMKEIEEICKT